MTDIYDQLLDEQTPQAAQPTTAQPDVYDGLLDEVQAGQRKALDVSLDKALKILPEKAATSQQLMKATGLPEDVVDRNFDAVQKQVRLREMQSLLTSSPILARQMADANFAKLAQDDLESLSLLERIPRQFAGGGVEMVGRTVGGVGQLLDVAQRNLAQGFANTFLPEPVGEIDPGSLAGPLLGEDWRTVGDAIKDVGRDIQIPALQQTFVDQVAAGVGQVGAQVLATLLSGGVLSTASLYAQGADAMAEKIAGDNASQGAKDLAVLGGAALTGITEKWALDKLLGPMAVPIQNQVGAALARIGIAGASEGAQEAIESIGQDVIRQYLTNPEAEIQLGQAFEEGQVGAAVGVIVRGIVEAAVGVRNRHTRLEQNAEQAEQNATTLEQLNQVAAASQLLQRSPESFEQFINAAAEDGPVQAVYIDAQTLMQSGVAEQLAQLSPSVAEQLAVAAATGGTVQIPIGEYAAKIAPTEFAQGLLDNLKTDPQGFSRNEAREYLQTQQQQLEEEIAQQLAAKAGDAVFMESKQRVKDTVLTELNTLGRFTPQKNELDATLIAARTAVRAAQLGVTPEQFFESQRLRFAAERIDGQGFDQGVSDLPDAIELRAYLYGREGLSVDKLVNLFRETKATAPDLYIAADGDYGPIAKDVADQIPNVQLIIAKEADKGFAMDAEGHAYTIFKGRVIDHKQKDASEAVKMSHNMLRNLIGEMRNNDPAEMQRRQEQERRDAIENARAKRVENAPKLSGDFKADLQALADYAENFEEFERLLTADMLDTSNRNRTRLARATIALEPNAITAANVVENEPALVEDYSLYGTPGEKAVASTLQSKSKQATIYRGMPADQKMEAGDWVSFSKAYAKGHESNVDGKAATKQKTVSKEEIYWYGADVNEWVYVPKGTFGEVKTLRELWESLGQGNKPESYPEQLYNQFAGVKARNAPLEKLAIAQQMESKGSSAATIQRETGWSKGVDGMWRFEISDDQVAFVKSEAVANPAIMGYVDRNAVITEQGEGQFSGRVIFGGTDVQAEGASPEQVIRDLANKIAQENGLPGFDIDNVQAGDEIGLGSLINHPELFAAYPQLQTISVKFVSNVGYQGQFDPRKREIEIEIGRTPDQMLSTLLHEVQHAIQTEEGFAVGGSNEKIFTDRVKNAVRDLQAYSANQVEGWKNANFEKGLASAKASEIASNALKYQSAQRLIEYSKRDKPSGVFRNIRNEMQWIYGQQFYGNRAANDLQRMFYDLPKRGDKRNSFLRNMAWEGAQFLLDSIPAEQRQMFKDDTRQLTSLIKALDRQASKARAELKPLKALEAKSRAANYLADKTQYKAPYEIYRALAGEIEARTTQARQGLTAEERRNRPVRQDQDVDLSEAIVIIGGFEMLVPTVMRSAQQGPRGSFNPENNTIAMLKGADLSTFLHEAGHYFFESDIRIATEIVQANAVLGPESMTDGERQILNDVSALLTWHGFEGTVDEQIAQWNALSFEQKRVAHERTAESFEAYLFEGKAPSIELQPYFQQFRAWLLSVYKSLKDFITNNPEAGTLTDEVRAVFDRMLATTEEIQLAEQGRSMMPLFRTQAEADNVGMTPQEFAAYQAQDPQATNDAIKDLEAKGLRDLQWTRNARNKEIKKLQRKAGELRKEAKDEARAQVVAEPVYKAWRFLTGKMTEGDKITPFTRPKSDPNVVDPTQDSLFTAIAKLGGLNKDELVATWGIDPAERPSSGVFGKPVLRKEGGRTVDGIIESLAEYGYLSTDENGKADLAEFEDKFDSELRGDAQYSFGYDYGAAEAEAMYRAGDGVDITALGAGRLDLGSLNEMDITQAEIELLKARRMVAKDGLHPDLIAELPGIEMSSGNELVRKLIDATPLNEEIEARAETIMLERHGELSTPQAVEREADKAIHNEARGRMIATEANALARATGQRKILATAAKQLAQVMVARIKVRDVKPSAYASAEARAAKAAAKASRAGDLALAAAEKRTQLVNTYATKAAYDALDEVDTGVRYLKKFEREGSRKGLDNEYLEQIDTLLERFDLRKGQSLKAIDKRTNLAAWVAAQEQAGLEPSIPDYILAEANRTSFKNLTVEEFRGLVDSVKQIEHLGRLKKKLLTAKDQRELDAIVDDIRTRMEEASGGRVVDNERRNTVMSKLEFFGRWINAAHRKAGSVVRELDGLEDGGPMWNYFLRTMNESGDKEAVMRADASQRLHEIAKPVLDGESMGGKGRWFPSLNRSLNRGERLAMALNWGNESNRQRLLGGKGWTAAQVQPVLSSLTATEWTFVQNVWDFFESYRPEIAAKELRVYGKEPDWIDPAPFEITTADGQQVQVRGGYYPVKYDPQQSGKAGEFAEAEDAKAMMRAAYTAATTRRSFTKGRAEEVQGRPLLLTFDGIWQGANEVIHDLTWHEWLIDANRLLKRLDSTIRNGFGAEYVDVLRKAVKDTARGDVPAANAVEKSLQHIRNGSTIVGMGWNVTTALMQPLGYSNSVVRIGGKWLARGMSEFFGSPKSMIEKAEEVQAKSAMMRTRMLTMNREINDVRNRLVADRSELRERIEGSFFIMIQKLQASVDYPTWLGAYAKAINDPTNDEARAIALADQAVIDAQGGGQIKDLAEVQRGHPVMKLFTNFYSYFNVLYNLTTEQTKKRVKAKEYGGLMSDYIMLMVVPAVMSAIIRNATKGEDDEDEYVKAIANELVGYPFGMFVGVRELAGAIQLGVGLGNPAFGYSGPAGLRFFSEMNKLGVQVGQGELDMALFKAANNVGGLLFHYPAGQVNRAVEGTAALIDGKTDNPLAPLVGVNRN
jgi:hypothetical protein